MNPLPPARVAPVRSVLRAVCALGFLVGGVLGVVGLFFVPGYAGSHTKPDLVWGRQGTQNGDLERPRAVAIDANDHLYIVDFTARIQVYDRDGHYLGPTWQTPDYRKGRPSGLSMDRDGNLIVSDSHYNCFRIYSPQGVVEKKRVPCLNEMIRDLRTEYVTVR